MELSGIPGRRIAGGSGADPSSLGQGWDGERVAAAARVLARSDAAAQLARANGSGAPDVAHDRSRRSLPDGVSGCDALPLHRSRSRPGERRAKARA